MLVPLDEAVRCVVDHGRSHQGSVEIPAADFAVLVGSYKAKGRAPANARDPDYEREMRKLFENAELNP